MSTIGFDEPDGSPCIWNSLNIFLSSSLSVTEELHDCLSDLHGLLVPPLGEEGDLGVHELPLGVVRQVARHVVQDVLHLVLVVLLVRLDPARIAVGVRHDEDLELVLGPRDRLLVVRDRPPLLPHTAVCIVIR